MIEQFKYKVESWTAAKGHFLHIWFLFSPNPLPPFFPFSDKGPVQEQRWKTNKKTKQNKTILKSNPPALTLGYCCWI